jgi:hypothetical protein
METGKIDQWRSENRRICKCAVHGKKFKKKYTDTEGWGFAKFSGNDLHPTGKSASFARESCIACHRQLAEKTGYLFDVPMKVNTERLIKNLQK